MDPKVLNMNLLITPTSNKFDNAAGHKPSKMKKINLI
jgi:hypothetical protein